jgi:hypothetical protein
MSSKFLFTLALVISTSALAQPRKKVVATPAATPVTVHETRHEVQIPAGTPPSAEMTSTGTQASNEPLLQKETEVRRSFHFEGFVEPQFTIVNKDWYPSRGFTLNDGALYLSKEFSRGVSAMIDLPFASTVAATGTSIGFGASRAQAYLNYVTGPVQVKFGQYDSIFGYERNDSRDRFFADAGIIKSNLLPATHVGLMGGYSFGAVTLRGQLTNQHDTSTMANSNAELGLQARFDGEPAFAAAGLTYSDQKNVSGSNMLIDVMAGVKMNQFTGGVYFDDVKTAGVDKHATGFGAQGSYNVSTDLGVGGRVEYASDFSDLATGTPAAVKNEFLISAGPSYRWMQDLTLRADADVASITPVTGDSVTVFGLQGSVVASF